MTETNHRHRVNAERRAKMRRRLMESAMLVVAHKGIEASQIDDVMKAAEVSRGGFYGHFRSMPELLIAIGGELGSETMSLIESRVGALDDPAARIACGLLLYLQFAQSYPQFARFVAAAGVNVSSPNHVIYEYLPPHIEAGTQTRRFAVSQMEVAVDLIAGTVLLAVSRMAAGDVAPTYCANVVASILMGLGMGKVEARKLSGVAMDALVPPPDALLSRSYARYQAAGTESAHDSEAADLETQ